MGLQRLIVGVLGMVLVIVPAGCSRAGGSRGGEGSSRQAAGTPAPSAGGGEVLFSDDFSDPASGFIHKDVGSRGADYRGGRYLIWVDNGKENYVASVGTMKRRPFSDGRIEVTAEPESLPDGAGFGVLCRVDRDGRSYYAGDVESDGSVRLLRYDPDQKVLARGEVSPLGDGPVHLELDCVGDRISFSVNGKEAAAASDGKLAKGGVGLTAGGGSEGMTRVAFDDLVVRAP